MWKIGIAGLAGAVVVAAAVFYVLVIRVDDPKSPLPSDSSPEARQLAEMFTPVLYLANGAPCDGNNNTDPYDPVAVGVLLDNDDVLLMRSGDDDPITPAPSAADLFDGEEDLYVDIMESLDPATSLFSDDRCAYEEAYGLLSHYRAVYARVMQQDGRTALQYWFFYFYNDWRNKHEADWEVIQLSFATESIQEILDGLIEPNHVAYSQHGGGRRRSWSDVEREPFGGTNPVVYVAAGSHANYFEDGRWMVFITRCDFAAKMGEARRLAAGLPALGDDLALEGADPGEYVLYLMDDPEEEDDPFAWLTFGGNWGEPSSVPGSSGISGPLSNKKTSDPFGSSDGLREGTNFPCPYPQPSSQD